MSGEKAPEDLEELLDRLEEAARDREKVTLDAMMDEVGRRSFGPLLLVAGLVMSMPVIGDIPGVPVVLGLFVFLVAVQLLWGRDHFWLPRWLLDRSVSAEKLRKVTRRWLRKPAAFIDRFVRKRLEVFTGAAGMRVIASACIVLALATPVSEFVPFSANGLGAALTAFGLALVAHDGLVAALAFAITVVTLGLGIYVVI